ncbi:MAG: hypothetical protein ACRDZW_00725, partial [Acidimicrobiales bacterium]
LQELALRATAADPPQRPTAGELAAEIRHQVPTARLPRPRPAPLLALDRPRPAQRERRLPRRAVAAALAAVVVAISGFMVMGHRGPPVPVVARPGPASTRPVASPTTPASPTTSLPPVATRVWPRQPLDFHDGVLAVDGARYQVGQAGDAAVRGDWACQGQATLVLLRPATGEVFAFDGWADDSGDLTARSVGRFEGSTHLEVADVDADGCDDLLAARPNAGPVTVAVSPESP